MDNNTGTQAVDRAIRLLCVFDIERPERSLSEIAGEVGLNPSTTRRILTTLLEHGLIEQDPVSRRYRLGIKLFELGSLAAAGVDLQRQATPTLRRLVREYEETAHLSVLSGNHVLCLQKIESSQAVRTHSRVGMLGPLHCTGSGKVLAAFLEEQLDQISKDVGFPRFTERTITDLQALKDHFAKIRENGYAVDDREHEEEVRCVAAPVRDHSGQVVATISLTGPAHRFSQDKIEEIADSLKRTTARLSISLGYDPDNLYRSSRVTQDKRGVETVGTGMGVE